MIKFLMSYMPLVNIVLKGNGGSLTGSSLELSIKENVGVIPNATFSSTLGKSNNSFNNTLRGKAKFYFLKVKIKKTSKCINYNM